MSLKRDLKTEEKGRVEVKTTDFYMILHDFTLFLHMKYYFLPLMIIVCFFT